MQSIWVTQLTSAKMSLRNFYALCKPRVTALIVFTAIIGMFMATPGMVSLQILLAATVGIAFASGAAAAFNCLIEHKIDAMMARTRARPIPTGQLSQMETLLFASVLGGLGLSILYYWVNPMNIVIGGASGAMPPILGWAAVNNTVSPEALVMFLIIFAWTPPHFWALALYRREEYAKVGMPMLPVTHGEQFTLLHILLYTVILIVVSLMPYGLGMSGWLYLASSVVLNAVFLYYVVSLYRRYSDELAKTTFKYSILYLSLIFAALLLDHYLI